MNARTAPISLDDYDTLDGVYEDFKRLIWDTCHRFTRSYGGDVEEHFADASTLFMRAFRAYKPDKGGAFSTILRAHVHGGLLDAARLAGQRNSRLPRQSCEVLDEAAARSRFDFNEFRRSISKNAAAVAYLTVNIRHAMEEDLRMRGRDPNSRSGRLQVSPEKIKANVFKELRETWEWSSLKILLAFRELSIALAE